LTAFFVMKGFLSYLFSKRVLPSGFAWFIQWRIARQLREGVEEVVLQALGHRERRNILEIVASSGGGVLYSDILNELGMNTGKLNYHLKLLEGIIEKDDSRRYRLTELGVRAFGLLRGLTEDLDEESARRFSSVKGRRDEFVGGGELVLQLLDRGAVHVLPRGGVHGLGVDGGWARPVAGIRCDRGDGVGVRTGLLVAHPCEEGCAGEDRRLPPEAGLLSVQGVGLLPLSFLSLRRAMVL